MKNTTIDALYELAEQNDIPVDETCPESIISMSVRFKNGKKVIGLSKFDSDENTCSAYTKTECFAHEMGHCMTDSFYSGYSPLELRSKHEYRANVWATEYLIPFKDLCKAVKSGCRELWELAEYFGVSNKFIEKSIHIHESKGNIVPAKFYN